MAYVALGQAAFLKPGFVKRGRPVVPPLPSPAVPRPRFRKMQRAPWEEPMEAPPLHVPAYIKSILAKREQGLSLSAWEEQQLHGFFSKIFKPIKKVVKAIVKPVLQVAKKILPVALPAVATIFGGPAAGAAAASIMTAMKSAKVKEQAFQEIQASPSWATLTLAEQQAILNAMAAGQPPPNIAVPADVAAAYARAAEAAMRSVPIVQHVPATPTFAPAPMMPPPEYGAAPVPTQAEMTGGIIPGMGPMGSMAVIGGGVLLVTMMMGGGGRRR